jgi:hypothetical protein
MENQQYRFDFSFLKKSIWITVFLAILKLAGVINIDTIWVFVPIFIALALMFFIVFLIGLIVIYLVATGAVNTDNETETEEKTEEES